MPKQSRKELIQYATEQKQRFSRFIDKDIQVRFGPHSFDTKILDIKLAKQADMENTPVMRVDENGNKYTPSCLHIICEGGDLFFIIEDITIHPLLDSILVSVENSVTVSFSEQALA